MNIFEGYFYTTAFAVRDERAFHDDPDMEVFRQHFDMFSGVEGTLHVHCFTHKTGAPGTRLRVMRPAILSLTADVVPSQVPMEDPQEWVPLLQRHLHPDFGIVVINSEEDGRQFQTWIAQGCCAWSR